MPGDSAFEGPGPEGLFAGLDVSTQSCKLVVLEPRTGEVVHVDAVNYDRDLPHFETHQGTIVGLGEGVSESDPRMWIEAVERVLRGLGASPVDVSRIRCLSVSGQQHGLVAIDADGGLARPRAKLWNDYSTQEECEMLTASVGGPGRMIEEVGNSQRTGYTAPKILHMRRHEPDTYSRAHTLFLVHNYINWWLTGGIAVMEPGDTSGMALWNPRTGGFSDAVLSAIAPDLAGKLPPVRPADRSIGAVGGHLVEHFGFAAECRVDAGSGDNMYAAVGTGNIAPGVVTISLGTSGTACSVTDAPWIDASGEVASFCDSTGRYLSLLCVSNMANGYEAVRTRFGLSHAEFSELVQRTTAGNGGRLLIPWYEGERTPDLPVAAPLYFGFGIGDFNAEILARAALEGHVLNLQAGFSDWPVRPERLHLTGGLAQSRAWCQTIADVFEIEAVPVEGEGAALGAALHGAWVWGNENEHPVELIELTDAFVVFAEERRCSPDLAAVEHHRLQRELFAILSDRIRGAGDSRAGADPFTLRAQLAAMEIDAGGVDSGSIDAAEVDGATNRAGGHGA